MEEARENFEEQWRDAFEHEEIAPPAHVWNSIDAVMASTREEGYKKKILFFKWIPLLIITFSATMPPTSNPAEYELPISLGTDPCLVDVALKPS